jgi:hypothetical protein
MQRLGEFYSLRQAMKAADELPRQVRETLTDATKLGSQKAEAARTLWASAHRAEAIHLAVRALDTTLAGVEAVAHLAPKPPVAEAEPPPESQSEADGASQELPATPDQHDSSGPVSRESPATGPPHAWTEALAAWGLSKKSLTLLKKAHAKAVASDLPSLNSDVTEHHASLFHEIGRANQLLQWHVTRLIMTRKRLRLVQIWRFALTFGVALAVVAVLALLVRPPAPVVTASAYYAKSPELAPINAVDDDLKTEWILPDRKRGWLEVKLPTPRRINKVRLVNAHNRRFNDRATRDYRVEFFLGKQLVHTITGNFPKMDTNPQWVEHPVNIDNVDRIRFVVVSYHRLGGGLTEIAWE